MFFKHLWKALVWAAFILVLCILPAREIPDVKLINADKAVHVLVYVLLGFLTFRGFSQQTAFPSLRCFAVSWSFFYCTLYGGLLELVQHYFVPDRLGDWYDFAANTAGTIGVSVFCAIRYRSL